MKLALLASVAALGCGGDPPPTDPMALEVTPVAYLYGKSALADLADGDPIDLTFPPQGGHVLFVGARARGLRETTVEMRGRLLDLDGAKIGEDARTVTMIQSAADPALWEPDLRSYLSVSNIPVCPKVVTVDLYGRPYQLEVVVTELSSRRAGTGRRTAVPSCRQTDPTSLRLCQCECAANYTIGKCR